MDLPALQTALKKLKLYDGEIDNDPGPETKKAVDALLDRERVTGWRGWPYPRRELAAKQVVCRLQRIDVGEIDGLMGPQTMTAFDTFLNGKVNRKDVERENAPEKPVPMPAKAIDWPRQAGVERFYGSVGKNQTVITPPWDMVLAWDTSQKVSRISLHEKVAPSAKRVMERIADAYTVTQLREMGVHLFGGSLNVRRMRGGSAWSMHSWGIAIDFDPARNQLKWTRNQARLAKPDAELFWKLWEEEGWVSLGRLRNYDWMHVQAARL